MWHTKRFSRTVLVPFAVLTALLGADLAPAVADGRSPGPTSGRSRHLSGGDPRALGAKIFKGQAFDTCRTPSSALMRAWYGTSPFKAVGVYIGGRARACTDQPHLDADWVQKADATGWKLLPLYVGSQSYCVRASNKRAFTMSRRRPAEQGGTEGRDAVRQAKKLGLGKRSAVYLDMEAYNNSNTACAITTLRFIQGWNRAVRKAGYLPGFYSSSDSGIEHMEGARKAGRKNLPEMLWFARWRVKPSLNNDKYIARDAWKPHRRIHQYDGNVRRTYGGHSLNIDRNLVDAPVAVVR
ncbi:DUF1906 domain-containing protein [Streptomyces ovatisporus]|uniref:DUF1906 domain-containing protein n=1 Tax=Streptomyces ovatisporus TaxID=1128682 RepID=A0ABV9ACT1_9ACTN